MNKEFNKKNFLEAIKFFEGFSPRVCKDPCGSAAIGYGHLLRPGEQHITTVSEDEATQFLVGDVLDIMKLIDKENLQLKENERCAIVDFAYNIGFGKMKKYTLWTLIRQYSDFVKAEDRVNATALRQKIAFEFEKYRFYHDAAGKVHESKGLKRRREFEKNLFVYDVISLPD